MSSKISDWFQRNLWTLATAGVLGNESLGRGKAPNLSQRWHWALWRRGFNVLLVFEKTWRWGLLFVVADKSKKMKIHREILKLYEIWSVTVDDPCQYETMIPPEFLNMGTLLPSWYSFNVWLPSKPWSYRQAAFFSNALGCEAALCTSDQQLVLLRRSGAHLKQIFQGTSRWNADMRCKVLILEVLLELILVCSLTSSFALHFCFQGMQFADDCTV